MEVNESVLRKVKHHPELKDLTKEEQRQRAAQLTSHHDVRCMFSYLLETGAKLTWEVAAREGDEDDKDELLHTMEVKAAHQRAKQDVAQSCHLPVKLILSKLRRGRPPLANTFTSLFRFEYGPLHAALQVGEVLIEWGRESLVVPHFEPIVPGRDLQFHVHGQGEFREVAGQFVREMSMADYVPGRNTEQKVDVLYRSVVEKNRLIENLVDVIVKYNREYKYDLFKCNCQHFVRDAMSALGIKQTPQFSGKLSEYYELLKNGKTKMPEFQTHESVDRYVEENFDELSQHDMEFLLCQYFQHHYADLERAEDVDNWKCTLASCKSDMLEERIKHNSLLFNQFHDDVNPRPAPRVERNDRHQVREQLVHEAPPASVSKPPNFMPAQNAIVREQLVHAAPPVLIGQPPNFMPPQNGIIREHLVHEALPALPGEPLDFVLVSVKEKEKQDMLIQPAVAEENKKYIQEELPREFMHGVSLERQESLLGKCKGYRECISFKLSTHPAYMDKNDVEIESMVNILGECRNYQDHYFSDDLFTCQGLAIKMVADFESPILTQEDVIEAEIRARNNFDALSNFPLKLMYYPADQGFSVNGRAGGVLDIPLEVRLQLGPYELDWNIVGLVIPNKAHTKHFQPVLSLHPAESKWSKYVYSQRLKVDKAIQDMTPGLQMQLMLAKREELLADVVEVIVDYNRHREYDEKRLSNSHFVSDVCKAAGIPADSIVQSMRQFNESRYATRSFTSHVELDNFVFDLNWGNKTSSLPQIDIQYLITQYFHFHVMDWQSRGKPEHWVCGVRDCQLTELERLVH